MYKKDEIFYFSLTEYIKNKERLEFVKNTCDLMFDSRTEISHIDKYKSFYKIKVLGIKHLFFDGMSYWYLYDKTNKKKTHLIKTKQEISVIGGCISELVWIRLAVFREIFLNSLEDIKENIDSDMVIKDIYLPYLYSVAKQLKNSSYNDGSVDFEAFITDCERNRFLFTPDIVALYNGEQNGYFDAKRRVLGTINGLYGAKGFYEAMGQWDRIRGLIDEMYDFYYDRGCYKLSEAMVERWQE